MIQCVTNKQPFHASASQLKQLFREYYCKTYAGWYQRIPTARFLERKLWCFRLAEFYNNSELRRNCRKTDFQKASPKVSRGY